MSEVRQIALLYVPVCIVLVVLTAIMYSPASPVFYYAPFLYLLFFLWQRKGVSEIQLIDLFLIGLLLVECVCYVNSLYSVNSLYFTVRVLAIGFFYFFIREFILHEYQRKIILIFMAGFGVLLAGKTILSFVFFHISIAQEFNDVTQFRNLFHPMGRLVNHVSTMLLVSLPFQAIVFVKTPRYLRWIPALALQLTAVALILTFSRGIYLSLALFIFITLALIWYTKIFSFQKVLRTASLFLLTTFLMTGLWYKEILATMTLFRSESHVRSAEGRLRAYGLAVDVFKSSPWLGIGAKNFAMASSSRQYADRNEAFSSFVTNSYLQLFVEKGIIGAGVYALFFLGILYICFKKILSRKGEFGNAENILFGAGLFSILFRELLFSSLFEEPLIFLIVILIAFFITAETRTYANNEAHIAGV